MASDAAGAGASIPGTLLVRADSAAEREAAEQGARGLAAVHFCASPDEVAAKLRAGGVAGVVLELGPGGARRELPAIVTMLEGRARPLLLRVALGSSAIHEIPTCARQVNFLWVSFRGYDSLNRDVAAILAPALPERPRLAILSRIVPLLSGPATHIVTVATIAGRQVTPVPKLAALCGLSIRTLEVRCHEAGILRPKPLLGWMLALHAAWRMTRWGWASRQVAEGAGLSSTDALADQVKRATGLGFRECRTLGFDQVLERFAAALVVRRARSGSGGDPA